MSFMDGGAGSRLSAAAACCCCCCSDRPLTAAKVIASHPALPLLLDQDVFASARRIESSLLDQHDCTRALAWCGENRSRLNKIASPFEFDLRLQEFLTLVKQGEQIKAIEYARKFLAPAAITTAPAAAAPAATKPAAEGGSGSQRNQSSSQGADESKDSSSSDPPVQMVADPARVRVLQEAMNLLVFYGFEEEEDATAAAVAEAKAAAGSSNGASLTAASSSSSSSRAWHKYRIYWSPLRFHELVASFRRTHLAIYGLPPKSTLEYVLNIGLGSIKTNACACNHGEHQHEKHGTANGTRRDGEAAEEEDEEDAAMDMDDAAARSSGAAAAASSSSSHAAASPSATAVPSACPACTFPLSCLARSLPVAARSQSRLVCRLSGAVMDERNPPLVLPNGFVYSRAALQNMAKDNEGQVTCPRTKQTFALNQAKIAYVL